MKREENHRDTEGTERPINEWTRKIIGAGMEVHRTLGPGLLESAYELSIQGLSFKRQQSLPVIYKEVRLDCGYRLDFVVAARVVVELKAVERILPIHEAQLLTYLRLTRLKWGLILNFHAAVLKDGIRRLVQG